MVKPNLTGIFVTRVDPTWGKTPLVHVSFSPKVTLEEITQLAAGETEIIDTEGYSDKNILIKGTKDSQVFNVCYSPGALRAAQNAFLRRLKTMFEAPNSPVLKAVLHGGAEDNDHAERAATLLGLSRADFRALEARVMNRRSGLSNDSIFESEEFTLMQR